MGVHENEPGEVVFAAEDTTFTGAPSELSRPPSSPLQHHEAGRVVGRRSARSMEPKPQAGNAKKRILEGNSRCFLADAVTAGAWQWLNFLSFDSIIAVLRCAKKNRTEIS